MNVLVTGGAGFIGSHLCDALVGMGHRVTVVDNFVLGKRENVGHLLSHGSFRLIGEDLLHAGAMRRVFAGGRFDMVYHLAANSDIRRGAEDPATDYELTFLTTFRVLRLMREFGVGKLFFASTSAVYGEARDVLGEDYGPLCPVSVYGAGKLAGEAFISAFSSNYGVQAWVARFPNVVGERSTHGVVHDFIRKLRLNPGELEVLGDGNQCKPYVYVKDLVEGILHVVGHAVGRYNVYMLGTDTRTTVREIAATVSEEMGLRPRVVYTGGARGWKGDVPEFRYDLSRVNALGWKAKYTSGEAVRLAVRRALGK